MTYYEGPPLENGGTSIAGKESPSARFLFENGYIKSGQTVLDYGAGKIDRNGKYFREQGCKVYSYDPHNGTDVDGWKAVSNAFPKGSFDVAFSSYVLNVVPHYEEQKIIKRLSAISDKQLYVIRDDILYFLKKSLLKKPTKNTPAMLDFFYNEFGGTTLDEDSIKAFGKFGVRTSCGFQRIPSLDEYGMTRIKGLSDYKVYENG